MIVDKELLEKADRFIDAHYKPRVSKEVLEDMAHFIEANYVPASAMSEKPRRPAFPRRMPGLIREHRIVAGISAIVLVVVGVFAGLGIFKLGPRPAIASDPADTHKDFNEASWIARFIPPEQNPDGSFKSFRLERDHNAGTAMSLGQDTATAWPVNFDRAIKYYSQQLENTDPLIAAQAHTGMGIVYAMQAEPDTAIAHFDEALKITPDSTDTLINRGLVYAGKGGKENLEKARSDLNEALERNPEEKGIREVLTELDKINQD